MGGGGRSARRPSGVRRGVDSASNGTGRGIGSHCPRPVALVVVIALAACSGGHTSNNTTSTTVATGGITEARAIEIARAAWAKDHADFDFDSTRPEPDLVDGHFDVAFVPRVIKGPGGEPHVVVDRATGKVLDVYRTK